MSILQNRLKEVLLYDPVSGNFTWLYTHSKCKAKSLAGHKHKIIGYVSIWFEGRNQWAHRLAFLYMTGEMPEEVDHINHDKSDNRWENLRAVIHRQNAKNQVLRSTNTSGCCGVWPDKKTGKWQASITVDYKSIFLGSFIEKDDAIMRRKEAEHKYGFHTNHGEVIR